MELILCVLGGISWAFCCSFIPHMNRMYIYPIIVMINTIDPYALLIFVILSEVIGNQLELFQFVQPLSNSQNWEADNAAAFYINKRKTRYLLKELGFYYFISAFLGLTVSVVSLLSFNELIVMSWDSQYISLFIYLVLWGFFISSQDNWIHCLIYIVFNLLFSYLFVTRFTGLDTNVLMMSFGFLLFSFNVDQLKKPSYQRIPKDDRRKENWALEDQDGSTRWFSFLISYFCQYLVGIQSSVFIYQMKKENSNIDHLVCLAISKGVASTVGITFSVLQLSSKDAAANYINLLLQDLGFTQGESQGTMLYVLIGLILACFIGHSLYRFSMEFYIQLQNTMSNSYWRFIPHAVLGINLCITALYVNNLLALLPIFIAFFLLNQYRSKRNVNSMFSLTGIGALPLFNLLGIL